MAFLAAPQFGHTQESSDTEEWARREIVACQTKPNEFDLTCLRRANEPLTKESTELLKSSLSELPPDFREIAQNLVKGQGLKGGLETSEVRRIYLQLMDQSSEILSSNKSHSDGSATEALSQVKR